MVNAVGIQVSTSSTHLYFYEMLVSVLVSVTIKSHRKIKLFCSCEITGTRQIAHYRDIRLNQMYYVVVQCDWSILDNLKMEKNDCIENW